MYDTIASQAYKAAAIEIVREYMASADLAEVAEALRELGQPALQHIFVKQVRCQQHTGSPRLEYALDGLHSVLQQRRAIRLRTPTWLCRPPW